METGHISSIGGLKILFPFLLKNIFFNPTVAKKLGLGTAGAILLTLHIVV